jgi:hypothetical protein
MVLSYLASRLSRKLGSERSGFSRSLKADIPSRGPGKEVSLPITQADDSIIKGRVNMGHPMRYVFFLFALSSTYSPLGHSMLPP